MANKDDEKSKSNERSTVDIVVETTFKRYLEQWHNETKYLSSGGFDNKNYQAIIALGWDVVPYIIEQLRNKPCHLFVALHSIVGASPVKPEHAGYLNEMAQDWIKWWDSLEMKG
jgi:hypothetical protein